GAREQRDRSPLIRWRVERDQPRHYRGRQRHDEKHQPERDRHFGDAGADRRGRFHGPRSRFLPVSSRRARRFMAGSRRMSVALWVVCPAYQEEDCIAHTIDELANALDRSGLTWELIVVDDGSRDATLDRARDAARRGVEVLTHATNRGRG